MYQLPIPDDVAQTVIVEYLEPLTEAGIIDAIVKDFVGELRPYAQRAARHAIENRRHALNGADDNTMWARLREFLDKLSKRLEVLATLNGANRDLLRASSSIREWIEVIDRRPAPSSEVPVPAGHERLLSQGEVP